MVLRRDEAYIGVLIDDLVTKPSHEPYRMFTSRAEHRLVLRQDNADRRLTAYGHELGLIGDDTMTRLRRRADLLDSAVAELRRTTLAPARINGWLRACGASELRRPESAAALCRRPEVRLGTLLGETLFPADAATAAPAAGTDASPPLTALLADPELLAAAEVELKYEGYIARERHNIERLQRLEALRIPHSFDYTALNALSQEGREKLQLVRPRTLGQASRISGVSPADLSILLVQLRAAGRGRARA